MKLLKHRKKKKPIAVCKKVKIVVKDNPDLESLEELRSLIEQRNLLHKEMYELTKEYIEPITEIEIRIEDLKEKLLIK